MTYRTNKQIQKLAEDGQLCEAYKTVRRYGVIRGMSEWDEEEGHYKGANLAIDIEYRGLVYSFELLNGEVISMEAKES